MFDSAMLMMLMLNSVMCVMMMLEKCDVRDADVRACRDYVVDVWY